jgi:Rps23 Pro-64 3,4-dihydroxylase Tpa1-like proline 4-hydroxylase
MTTAATDHPAACERYATMIARRLGEARADLGRQWQAPHPRVRSFVLDDVLPADEARALYDVFPVPAQMMRRRGLKESKYVSAQLDRHAPALEAVTFAFQAPAVLALLEQITGIGALEPDPQLYAGGLSVMVRGDFLNPHLDNSHDGGQRRYRVLNALYYLTPGWREDAGGQLELWDQGVSHPPRAIASRCNRLVLMETTPRSWHSVSPIRGDGRRTCVSNYFFRQRPVTGGDYFHATSFRGRPGQPLRDLLLRVDNRLRTRILTLVRIPTRHIYDR